MPSPVVFEIGVLLFPGYQLLDAAGPVDYLDNHSQQYLKWLGYDQAIVDKAPIINWHYISTTGDLEPVQSTSGPKQVPTTTIADCPPLNYLLFPGADPSTARLPEDFSQFIKTRYEQVDGFLTVCTGSFMIAGTGVLDGLTVTSNKWALNLFATKLGILNRNVKWVGDRRFVVDGKVWSAAGVTAGIDLAAEFARVNFDPEVVEIVKILTEYVPNPAQPDPFAKILEGVKLEDT